MLKCNAMAGSSSPAISSQIERWSIVRDEDIDLSFLARQHRRRLSRTVQLALTAYHHCNPDLEPLRTVFASRYGEFTRTFGILRDLAEGQPASPAAFSVSVHNTPSGIAGIVSSNTAPSSTIAANGATMEAGFIEAAMQHHETQADVLLIVVDEPLPDPYAAFRSPEDEAYSLGLRLSGRGRRQISLDWYARTGGPHRGRDGVPISGMAIFRMLEDGVASGPCVTGG
jgi:hypothetical protein